MLLHRLYLPLLPLQLGEGEVDEAEEDEAEAGEDEAEVEAEAPTTTRVTRAERFANLSAPPQSTWLSAKKTEHTTKLKTQN